MRTNDIARPRAPLRETQFAPLPHFLQRQEPQALYSFRSDGRLVIEKGETSLTLEPADLAELRRFVARFEGAGE